MPRTLDFKLKKILLVSLVYKHIFQCCKDYCVNILLFQKHSIVILISATPETI